MIERHSGVIIAAGPLAAEVARRTRRKRARGPWLQQTCLLATALVCLALMAATVGELWVRIGLDQQVANLRAQNTHLSQDIAASQRAIQVATSDATIAREARQWGYIQSGGH